MYTSSGNSSCEDSGSGQLTSIKYLSHLGCNLFSVLHKNCLKMVCFEGFPYKCVKGWAAFILGNIRLSLYVIS